MSSSILAKTLFVQLSSVIVSLSSIQNCLLPFHSCWSVVSRNLKVWIYYLRIRVKFSRGKGVSKAMVIKRYWQKADKITKRPGTMKPIMQYLKCCWKDCREERKCGFEQCHQRAKVNALDFESLDNVLTSAYRLWTNTIFMCS